MSSTLTPAQKAQIEENRQLALQRRALKLEQASVGKPKPLLTPPSNNVKSNLSSSSTTCTPAAKLLVKYPPLERSAGPNKHENCLTFPKKQIQLNTNVGAGGKEARQVKTAVIGTCKLISKERFTVDMPYHQQTVYLFRTIQGKEYGKKYIFTYNHYHKWWLFM